MHSAAPRALIHTRATILHVTPLPCNNYIMLECLGGHMPVGGSCNGERDAEGLARVGRGRVDR